MVGDVAEGAPFPDEGAHELLLGDGLPGLDEALEGVALFFEVDVSLGNVVPRLGEGVDEVMPADLGEHEGFVLLGGKFEDLFLDGQPGFVEFFDGTPGFLASS